MLGDRWDENESYLYLQNPMTSLAVVGMHHRELAAVADTPGCRLHRDIRSLVVGRGSPGKAPAAAGTLVAGRRDTPVVVAEGTRTLAQNPGPGNPCSAVADVSSSAVPCRGAAVRAAGRSGRPSSCRRAERHSFSHWSNCQR